MNASCEPECPVSAIYSEDELTEGQEIFIMLNNELSQIWPHISEVKDSLPDAEKLDGVKNKKEFIER